MVKKITVFVFLLAFYGHSTAQKAAPPIANNEMFRLVPVLLSTSDKPVIDEELYVDDIEGYIKRGYEFLIAGNYPEALVSLDHAIEIYPEIGVAYYYRGIAKKGLGDLTGARADLKKAIELENMLFDARLELGLLELSEGNADLARKEFEIVQNANPKMALPWFYLGRLELVEQVRFATITGHPPQFSKAQEYFYRVLQQDSAFAEAYAHLGLINIYDSKPALAIKDFDQALKYDSLLIEAHLGKGYAYLQKEELENCLASWQNLTRLYPEESRFFVLIGYLYIEGEQYDKAIRSFHAALSLNKSDSGIVDHKDPVTSKIVDFKYAINYYYRSRDKLDPYSAWLIDKGLSYLLSRQYKEAKMIFINVAGISQDVALPYFLSAMASEYMSEFVFALKNYSKAISLDSTIADAYRKRGLIYYVNYQAEEAVADFNQLVKLEPQLKLGYRYRAMANKLAKNYEQALPDYNYFIAYDSSRADVLYERGYCLEKLGQTELAYHDYLAALSLVNEQEQVFRYRALAGKARILLLQGDTLQAENIVDNIIAEDGFNDEALTLKGAILLSQGKPKEAIYFLNDAINNGTIKIASLMLRSKALIELKYYKEAIGDLTNVISNQSENGEAYFCRAFAQGYLRKKNKALADFKKSQELGYSYDSQMFTRPLPKVLRQGLP